MLDGVDLRFVPVRDDVIFDGVPVVNVPAQKEETQNVRDHSPSRNEDAQRQEGPGVEHAVRHLLDVTEASPGRPQHGVDRIGRPVAVVVSVVAAAIAATTVPAGVVASRMAKLVVVVVIVVVVCQVFEAAAQVAITVPTA